MNIEKPDLIIHGNAPDEVKEEIAADLEKTTKRGYSAEYSNSKVERLKKFEIPKTPIDIEAIHLSNKLLNELLGSYGIESVDISDERVHILPPDIYKKVVGPEFAELPACYLSEHRSMFIKYEEGELHSLARVAHILHEMIHSREYRSEQVFKFVDGDKKQLYKGPFRGGIRVFSNLKKVKEGWGFFNSMFVGLNEAVVVEVEKILLQKMIGEMNMIPKEPYTNMKAKIMASKKYNIPVEEIEFVVDEGMSYVAYYEQRKVLNYIIDSIIEDGDKRSRKEILDIFIRAHFTGRLLEVGRLVEKSFGPYSFRRLTAMGVSKESVEETVSLLEAERALVLGGE